MKDGHGPLYDLTPSDMTVSFMYNFVPLEMFLLADFAIFIIRHLRFRQLCHLRTPWNDVDVVLILTSRGMSLTWSVALKGTLGQIFIGKSNKLEH